MASIEKYISDLLCLHDCVIVPGLGGFVANYRPSVIVNDRNQFFPPSKEIGFNRSLAHNDGLLANYICQCEHITYNESVNVIADFVSGTQIQINDGRAVRFQGVGTFQKDALGSFQFTPDKRNELRPDAFGLDEFHFEPLHFISLNQKDEEPVRRLLRSRSPRYWASVAAVIAGLFLVTPELKMPEHQKVDTGNIASSITATQEKENHSSDHNTTENSDITTRWDKEAATEEIVNIENNTVNSNKAKQIDLPFHIIAGSFKHEAPAQTMVQKLKNKGFEDASILHKTDNRFRVAVFSFEKRQEAINKMYALRDQEEFKNAWLFSK